MATTVIEDETVEDRALDEQAVEDRALDEQALDEQALDETFAALANSTRRRILERLAHGPASVNELAEPFDLTLPAVSKHIKVLERAGLIVRSRRAQFRPCALDVAPLARVSTWTEEHRSIWRARLDRMDDHLRHVQQRGETGEHDG